MSGERFGEHGTTSGMSTLDAGISARRTFSTVVGAERGAGGNRWSRSRRTGQSLEFRVAGQSCMVFEPECGEWAMIRAIASDEAQPRPWWPASATATYVPCAKEKKNREITRQNRPFHPGHFCARHHNLCARMPESGNHLSISMILGSFGHTNRAPGQREQETSVPDFLKIQNAPTSVSGIHLCANTIRTDSVPEKNETPALER